MAAWSVRKEKWVPTVPWCFSPMRSPQRPSQRNNMKKKTLAILCVCAALCVLLASALVSGRSKELTDGDYTIAVSLSGGSGRASVESPAKLVVSGETRTAGDRVEQPILRIYAGGWSAVRAAAFGRKLRISESPIRVLDTDMEVSASTIAMSQPHLVEYTLRFDSSTIQGE